MYQYDEAYEHSKLVYRSAVQMDEEATFTKHHPTVPLVAIKEEVLPSPETVTISFLCEDGLNEIDPLASDPLCVQQNFDLTTKIKMEPQKETEVFVKSEYPDNGTLTPPCIHEHDFESNSDTGKTNCTIEVDGISTVSTSDNRVPRCNITLHQSIQGITAKDEIEISTEEFDKAMDTFNSQRKYSASKCTQYLRENNTCSRTRVMRKWSERNNSQAKTDAKEVILLHDFERMPMVVIPRNKEIDRLAAELRPSLSSSEQSRTGSEVTSVPVAKLTETAFYKGAVISETEYGNGTEKIPPVKLRKITATGTWENASELEDMLDCEIVSLLGSKETFLLMKRAAILQGAKVKNTQQTKRKKGCEKENTNIDLSEDEINDNTCEVQKISSEVENQTEDLHIAETDKMLDGQSCGQENDRSVVSPPQKRCEAIKGLSSHVCPHCHAIFRTVHSLHGHWAHCSVRLDKAKTTLSFRAKSTLIKKDLRSNHIESNCSQKNLKAMKYSCKFCGKIVSCKSIFLRHVAMHINGRKYWCHVCGKGFTVTTSLKRHLRVHIGDRPFQCGVCGKSYTTKSAMQFHKRKAGHHSTEEKLKTAPKNKPLDVDNCTLQCNICEKTFLSLRNFTKHRNIHERCPSDVTVQKKSVEKEKNLETKFALDSNNLEKDNRLCCQICDKEFSSNYCLKDHHYYHIGNTTFRCDSCQVAYRTADGLRHHHNKVHVKELLLSCKYCRKSFSSHIDLGRHKCTNGKAEFLCEHCQKVFPTDESLNLHKVIHVQQFQHVNTSSKKHYKTSKTRQCLICGIMLSSLSSLKRHILVHSGEKSHKCKICGKAFTNAYNCKIHEYIHTRERSIKCDICENTFYEKQALKHHKQLHRKEHLFTNDLCMKVFTSQCYKNNGKISNIRKPSTCNVCNKSFASIDAWKAHNLIHLKNLFEILPNNIPSKRKDKKEYSCSICGMILQSKSGFNRHRFLHSGKPLECGICSKKFSIFSRFQDHMIAHTTERPYQCNECPKKYASRETLQKHKQIHHKRFKLVSNTKSDKRPYKCSKCDSTFIQHSMLLRHKCFLHLNEKLFHCEVCSQSFSTHLNLRIHYKSHFEKKRQSCLHCNKSFSSLEDLNKHMLTHSAQMIPFYCHICTSILPSARDLESHICSRKVVQSLQSGISKSSIIIPGLSTHKNVKNSQRYKCKQCKKVFATNGSLTRHERLHINPRPFTCELCDVAFREKYKLRLHLRTHGVSDSELFPESYKCKQCNKIFAKKGNLARHCCKDIDNKKH